MRRYLLFTVRAHVRPPLLCIREKEGAAPTAILSRTCHPFRCFTTRSVQMTHNPKQEPWLHRLSLLTHHTTRILSYQSVEPVSQHTDTCCEQTHRSSRCRRYRHLCEILVLTISINHTSAAEHLDFSYLGTKFSATHCLLGVPPYKAH